MSISVPIDVTQGLERLVSKLHRDAEQFINVTLLDESQIFSLHAEVARIYQLGYDNGMSAQMERDRYARSRELDRKSNQPTKETTP